MVATHEPQVLTAILPWVQRPAAAAADATTGAATMQARQPAQQRYDQSMARATYGSGSLRMDEF